MRPTVPKNLRQECGFSEDRLMCMPRYIWPAILRTKKIDEQKDSEEEERQIG